MFLKPGTYFLRGLWTFAMLPAPFAALRAATLTIYRRSRRCRFLQGLPAQADVDANGSHEIQRCCLRALKSVSYPKLAGWRWLEGGWEVWRISASLNKIGIRKIEICLSSRRPSSSSLPPTQAPHSIFTPPANLHSTQTRERLDFPFPPFSAPPSPRNFEHSHPP